MWDRPHENVELLRQPDVLCEMGFSACSTVAKDSCCRQCALFLQKPPVFQMKKPSAASAPYIDRAPTLPGLYYESPRLTARAFIHDGEAVNSCGLGWGFPETNLRVLGVPVTAIHALCRAQRPPRSLSRGRRARATYRRGARTGAASVIPRRIKRFFLPKKRMPEAKSKADVQSRVFEPQNGVSRKGTPFCFYYSHNKVLCRAFYERKRDKNLFKRPESGAETGFFPSGGGCDFTRIFLCFSGLFSSVSGAFWFWLYPSASGAYRGKTGW